MKKITLIIILHNHQPVGNFGWVFNDATDDAYLPVLDVLKRHPNIKAGIHNTGPLLEWFEANRPDYIERLKEFVDTGQIEILGGAFYEPILSILPDRDKAGQIDMMNRWIESRFGEKPSGCWVAERIWEPGFASILGAQGLRYTTLDNTHFQYAGIPENRICGSYITEDQGISLRVLPIDYQLRYNIPFHEPQETIDYLAGLKERGVTAVTYADDGEKFGVWPGTKVWVYEKGWLERFFTALEDNADWIDFQLPRDYIYSEPPVGNVYLPTASYREMSEWALPTDAQKTLHDAEILMEGDDRFNDVKPFVRGGFWRNFLAKYPESNAMYRRMLKTSGAVEKAKKRKIYPEAARELYMSQCNCGYWHGVFGGLYLNFLRRAVYEHIIKAERLVRSTESIAELIDFDGDGHDEVVLSNNVLSLFLKPHEGGAGLELDFYPKAFNLFDTMTRHKEAYHSLIPETDEENDSEDHASIHDAIKAKDSDILNYLHYDWYRRLNFIDHFIPDSETLEAFSAAQYKELGNFVGLPYNVELLGDEPFPEVELARTGGLYFDDSMAMVMVQKALSIPQKGASLKAAYAIEFSEDDIQRDVLFGVEMNLGLQSGSADDSFIAIPGRTLDEPSLGSSGEEEDVSEIALTIGWMPLHIKITFSKPAKLWRLPIETVSQSEGGVEHNYQNTCLVPLWNIRSADSGIFEVEINMEVE